MHYRKTFLHIFIEREYCARKKKKKDRKKFLFFLDSWKRGCFSPHPSLLTDIFDGNKRAKSSLCITSTHDFRDYGAVPLNGHGGNSAIRSCRQTSSVSGHASVLHHLRPSQGPLLPRQEYNIRLDRTRSRPREFLKFLIPLLAKDPPWFPRDFHFVELSKSKKKRKDLQLRERISKDTV